jgi:predicted GTPase
MNSEMSDIPNQFLEATKVRRWFADQFEQMRQVLISSEGTDGGLALTNAIESLNNETMKLKDSKFRIMILGDFNRGKSTILNVLLGKELLPMGVTPTTSIPTHIIHGTEESVKVYKKDGSTETMKIQDYREKYTLNSNYVKRMIKKLASSVGNWLSTLERAEIQVPNDLLSRGVEFIDTAGLNSSDAEDKKLYPTFPHVMLSYLF